MQKKYLKQKLSHGQNENKKNLTFLDIFQQSWEILQKFISEETGYLNWFGSELEISDQEKVVSKFVFSGNENFSVERGVSKLDFAAVENFSGSQSEKSDFQIRFLLM